MKRLAVVLLFLVSACAHPGATYENPRPNLDPTIKVVNHTGHHVGIYDSRNNRLGTATSGINCITLRHLSQGSTSLMIRIDQYKKEWTPRVDFYRSDYWELILYGRSTLKTDMLSLVPADDCP